MAKKKQQGCMLWYLRKKKKPFAYSTKAEGDALVLLMDMYGSMYNIRQAYNIGSLILSPKELEIVDTFITNGELTPKLR